jgi:hypothetical protein
MASAAMAASRSFMLASDGWLRAEQMKRFARVARRLREALADNDPLESSPPGFDHARAQLYEFESNRRDIEEHFPRLIAALDEEIARDGVWYRPEHHWFGGDEAFFASFIDHLRDRRSLEIGSGPFGFLAFAPWIKSRTIIDPLIEKYRAEQLRLFGRTFFADVETHSQPAEKWRPDLVGQIDGCIVCQNALDHCEDPLAILFNLGQYAKAGCYLLFWSDIWHIAPPDEGHHNITRSQNAMDSLFSGLGFEIVRRGNPIRSDDSTIEYGIVARKVK